MNAERLRAHLLTLPHVVETMQWGANLVFWVGDKAIGGKMFALIDLDEPKPDAANPTHKAHPILSYAAGPARYSELLELDGIVPAPYMARIHWVAAERWDVYSVAEWQFEFEAAHALTLAKLSPRTRKVLALPAAEQRRTVSERKKDLAGRKTAAKSSRASTSRQK
jgi:predicted DNA-binding protein (MmcQ/YjbR family)